MKKILIGLCSVFGLLLSTTSCNEEYSTFDGPSFISLSDTLYVLPVQNNEEVFDIPVVASRACDYDRTLAVEVVDKKTNAIEGKQFFVESNTVTIPAGKMMANFRVRGNSDNITINDSVGINIRLLAEPFENKGLQNLEANIILQKVCPFKLSDFVGWCTVKSPYMDDYMPGTVGRLVKTVADTEEENTIIFKDYYYKGYDVKLRFTTDDILNPLVELDEQNFGPTSEAFGTIYGDGIIKMTEAPSFVSYYSSCEKFLIHSMVLSVPGVGVVGNYFSLVKWISDDEADRIKREGF